MGPPTSSFEPLYQAIEMNAFEDLDQNDITEATPRAGRTTSRPPAVIEHEHTIDPMKSPHGSPFQAVNSFANPNHDSSEEESPHEASAQQELENTPARKYRLTYSLWAVVLLFPVAVSAGILQLTFRDLYFREPQRSGTTELLGVLQLAAKAHEMLIVYTLSKIVLYYLRAILASSSGMPFGILASGYAQYLGKPPIEFGFWSGFGATWTGRHIHWRPFLFTMLVLLSTFIGLAAGPASAIALIPQLNWWHSSDLFYFDRSVCLQDNPKDFSLYIPKDVSTYIPKPLFPSEVNTESLPVSSCLNATLDMASFCPYQGLADLSTKLNWTNQGKFTIDTGGTSRVVYTDFTPSGYPPINDIAQAWTTSQLLSGLLSQGVVKFYSQGSELASVEARASQSRLVRSPQVEVSCQVDSSTNFSLNLDFLASRFGSSAYWSSSILNSDFDVRSIWSEETLREPSKTFVEWREFQDTNKNPILTALILVRSDTQGPGMVSICPVHAVWAEATMFLIPSQSSIVISDVELDFLYINDYTWEGKRREFNIHKEWVDALNARNNTTNSSTLATFIDASSVQYRAHVSSTDPTYPGLGHSLMLATAVANGVASIGLDVAQNITVCHAGWCSQGPYYTRQYGYTIYNGTRAEGYQACGHNDDDPISLHPANNDTDDSPILQTFREPDRAFIDSQWTQVSFPIFKYGYGWSFTPRTIKFAAAILLLHALVVIVHVCYVLFAGLCFDYAGSLAELLALALESQPAKVFKPKSIGKSRETPWVWPAVVREVETSNGDDKKFKLIVHDKDIRRRGMSKEERAAEDADYSRRSLWFGISAAKQL